MYKNITIRQLAGGRASDAEGCRSEARQYRAHEVREGMSAANPQRSGDREAGAAPKKPNKKGLLIE